MVSVVKEWSEWKWRRRWVLFLLGLAWKVHIFFMVNWIIEGVLKGCWTHTLSLYFTSSIFEGFSCPHTRGFHRSQLVSLKIFYCHVLYKEVLRCHSAAPFNGLLSCSLVESRSSLQLFSCSTTPLSVSQKVRKSSLFQISQFPTFITLFPFYGLFSF